MQLQLIFPFNLSFNNPIKKRAPSIKEIVEVIIQKSSEFCRMKGCELVNGRIKPEIPLKISIPEIERITVRRNGSFLIIPAADKA